MLEVAGFQSGSALSVMTVIGSVNMIFTIIAIKYVDRLGRRLLMQIEHVRSNWLSRWHWGQLSRRRQFIADRHDVRLCCLLRVLARPIKFIFASEIFSTNIRSHAMSITILTMWTTDTLVGQLTPALRDGIGPANTFFLFSAILVPQIFMVWKFMPETADRSLEEIEQSYQ